MNVYAICNENIFEQLFVGAAVRRPVRHERVSIMPTFASPTFLWTRIAATLVHRFPIMLAAHDCLSVFFARDCGIFGFFAI